MVIYLMTNRVKVINKSDYYLPQYETSGSAGMDLRANESEEIFNGDTKVIGTGLFVAVPRGFELQVRSRSGMSINGITVANAPGTIDSDYRGEIKVIIHNGSTRPFQVNAGDRVAQIVLCPIARVNWYITDELDSTDRGEGGFGSTGTL